MPPNNSVVGSENCCSSVYPSSMSYPDTSTTTFVSSVHVYRISTSLLAEDQRKRCNQQTMRIPVPVHTRQLVPPVLVGPDSWPPSVEVVGCVDRGSSVGPGCLMDTHRWIPVHWRDREIQHARPTQQRLARSRGSKYSLQ